MIYNAEEQFFICKESERNQILLNWLLVLNLVLIISILVIVNVGADTIPGIIAMIAIICCAAINIGIVIHKKAGGRRKNIYI